MAKSFLLLSTLLVLLPATITALAAPANKFKGGAGVGRLNLDEKAGMDDAWKCKYDMVLVERLQKLKSGTETSSGLFVPEEDLPRLHVCKGMFCACNLFLWRNTCIFMQCSLCVFVCFFLKV